MASDSELQIVIRAIDEASATLKTIASESNTALGGMAAQTESAGMSFGHLEEHILASMVAYRLLLGAVEGVKGFFEDSIGGAMEAGDTLAQLRVNVENAGLSYKTLGPQVKTIAEEHTQLGYTVEETEQSLGKLLLTTGNYKDAVNLNNLAMDLARSKSIDLNTATVLVEQVMAGNTRVMKQYGISLDSATTSAEALTILQDKVKGSAAAAADTAAGKWREVQAQWKELEVAVGEQILPVIEQFFQAFADNMPRIMADIEDLVSGMIAFGEATAILPLIAGYFKLVGDAVSAVATEWDVLTGRVQEYANAQQTLTPAVQTAIDKHNELHSSLQITQADFKQMDLKEQEAFMKRYGSAVSSTAASFDDITNRIQRADNAAIKHADAIAKLSAEYDKMKSQGTTDLADLSDAFQTKMEAINKTIADTQQKIADLTASYGQKQVDETTKVAEKIAASEEKIADLKEKIAKSTNNITQQSLQDQLTAEQANYDSSLSFRQAHADAMAKASARAKETDLQQTIDDYTAKQDLDAKDYAKKLATLQKELKDKQDEATKETNLYTAKVAQINKILDAGNAYFQKLSDDRRATTTKEVDAEIQQFQRLAAAIGGTKSANATSLSTISIPHFATGGIVDRPTLALVGEAGPEAIIPLSAFNGNPSVGGAGLPGGGGIVVNILGGSYLDSKGATMIADAIGRNIAQQLRLKNFV
jgi:hypothetical protein